jgi:hypothetical protein
VRRRGILTRRTGHLQPGWGGAESGDVEPGDTESSAADRGAPAR